LHDLLQPVRSDGVGRVPAPGEPDGHAAAAIVAPSRRQSAHADAAGAWGERQRRPDRGGRAVLHRVEGCRHGGGDGALPARGPRHPRAAARRRLDRPQHAVVRTPLSQERQLVTLTDQEPDPGAIAAMVERAEAGDAAAKDALFASLYGELHRLAESHIRRGGSQLTMGATTLLHEASLALNGRSRVAFPDRPRFLKYASRAMRGLVIDYVRSKHAQKRGGEVTFTAMPDEGRARRASRRSRRSAMR